MAVTHLFAGKVCFAVSRSWQPVKNQVSIAINIAIAVVAGVVFVCLVRPPSSKLSNYSFFAGVVPLSPPCHADGEAVLTVAKALIFKT